MNLARAYTRVGAALLVLAITAYCTASGEALLAATAAPAILAGWLWTAPPRRRALPRIAVNVLLGAVVILAVASAMAGNVGVESFAHFAVLLQLVKLGDRRRPRDDGQILLLSVFLSIAALLTDLGLAVGVQLIALVPVLMASVMLYQLQSAAEEAAGPQRSASEYGSESNRAWARHLRRLVGATTVVVFFGAAVVFVAIPRGIGRNAFGDPAGEASGSVTGFTDQIVLGQRSVISESERPVLTVTVSRPGGENLGDEGRTYYLRGAVLDEYAGGVWTVRTGPRAVQEIRRRDFVPGLPYVLGAGARNPIEQRISIRDGESHGGYLFALWRPAAITFNERPRGLLLNSGDRTMIRRGRPGPVEYTVWSALAEPGVREPRERTEVSFPSERVRELAAAVLREGGIEPDPRARPIRDDQAAAALFEVHLRSGYGYTLEEEPIEPGRDPIEQFLFTTRRGHCEYFASAMVAMCRSVGINARVVTGFVASEFVPSTGHYIVRANNAHAWVEAELGRGRWKTFDPTPPAELARAHTSPTGMLGGIRRLVEALQYAWDRSVVSFDEHSRARLLGAGDRPEDRFRPVRREAFDPPASPWLRWGSATVSGAVLVIAAAGAAVFAARLVGWRWPGRRHRSEREMLAGSLPAEQVRFYVQLLTLMRRRGVAKPDWRPPLAHAESLGEQSPELSRAAAAITEIYYRARFGGRPLDRSDLAAAQGWLKKAAEVAAPSSRSGPSR